MHVFLITFQAVAALLGIGLIGFWIIGRRQVPAKALSVLTSIALDIAIPCLILNNILTSFSPQKNPDWWHLPIWWIGFTLVTLVLSLASSFLVKKAFRSEFSMGLFFQNGIFFPLIIITGLFDNPAVYQVTLFLFIFLQPTLVFSTYPFFFRNRNRGSRIKLSQVINTVLIMTIFGLVLCLAGVQTYVPSFIMMILSMIGAMTIPLFMLILGGNIYNDFVGTTGEGQKMYTGEVIKFTLVKNLLFPLVILGLLIWIRPEYPIALILILQAAVPPITAIPIFAERLQGNRALSNQFVIASFIFSIVSIPAMVYLFSRFFPFPS
jgi:malate permease and related proteins